MTLCWFRIYYSKIRVLGNSRRLLTKGISFEILWKKYLIGDPEKDYLTYLILSFDHLPSKITPTIFCTLPQLHLVPTQISTLLTVTKPFHPTPMFQNQQCAIINQPSRTTTRLGLTYFGSTLTSRSINVPIVNFVDSGEVPSYPQIKRNQRQAGIMSTSASVIK